LRVVIEFQSLSSRDRKLTLDIVDYPGEWLLDLPLLGKSYESWASDTIRLSREGPRLDLAKNWHLHLATLDPRAPENEQEALIAARLFTEYLKSCRDQNYALSLLPPGRFLMPGDLANTPALTFAPLELSNEGPAPAGSLWAMMRRRYESYRAVVVRPFFRDHFARLDRQIVLVDALAAINAGPEALRDLEHALNEVLAAFEVGRRTVLSAMLRPRIDRILLAATKADHLHHTSHDHLESILRRLAQGAISKAEFAGAQVDVIALSAVRATREATARRGRQQLPCVVGVPLPGEAVVGEIFDGETEVAIFPGDLPEDPDDLLRGDKNAFRGLATTSLQNVDFRFLRVRPPALELTQNGVPALPHIRLDRALQFLIGDKLV
jgi:predicted YcjX-like family ATPase